MDHYEYLFNGTTDTYFTNGTVSRYEYTWVYPGYENMTYWSDSDCNYTGYSYYTDVWCNNGSYIYLYTPINSSSDDYPFFTEYFQNGSYVMKYQNGTVEHGDKVYAYGNKTNDSYYDPYYNYVNSSGGGSGHIDGSSGFLPKD